MKLKYSCKDGREQAGFREDRNSLRSARGDWAICYNSEVIEVTEVKNRRKELSARAKWAEGKNQVLFFFFFAILSCLAMLCFLCFKS